MEDCLCIQTIAKSVILPCDVKESVNFVPVERVSQVLDVALVK